MPDDLLADLRWRGAGALGQVNQMGVGGICEVQVPLPFDFAVEATLCGHAQWLTGVTLDGLTSQRNQYRMSPKRLDRGSLRGRPRGRTSRCRVG